MRLISYLTILPLLVVLACNRETPPTADELRQDCPNLSLENPTTIDSVDYEVWQTVLDSFFDPGQTVLIVQQVDSDIPGEDLNEEIEVANLENAEPELIEDFLANNQGIIFLDDRFSPPSQVITIEELACIFSNDLDENWRNFFILYPGSAGYVRISRPGYDDSMEKAFFRYSKFCGSLCGSGYLVILELENGTWRVKEHRLTWVS